MSNEKWAVLGLYACSMKIMVLLRCPASNKLKAASQLPRCNDSRGSWVKSTKWWEKKHGALFGCFGAMICSLCSCCCHSCWTSWYIWTNGVPAPPTKQSTYHSKSSWVQKGVAFICSSFLGSYYYRQVIWEPRTVVSGKMLSTGPEDGYGTQAFGSESREVYMTAR